MKQCPECGSSNVIYFTADDDTCTDCKECFPCVRDVPVASFSGNDLLLFAKFALEDKISEAVLKEKLKSWILKSGTGFIDNDCLLKWKSLCMQYPDLGEIK
jgi:hypothetical protein